jgi:biopolymer transport protein ExbB
MGNGKPFMNALLIHSVSQAFLGVKPSNYRDERFTKKHDFASYAESGLKQTESTNNYPLDIRAPNTSSNSKMNSASSFPHAKTLFGSVFFLLLTHPSIALSAEGAENTRSLLDLYREGGFVMHVIACCSVIAMTVGVYCAITLRKRSMLQVAIIPQLNELISQRDLNQAYRICELHPGPLTRALKLALIRANFQRDMYNKSAMSEAIADECFREETKMMVTVNYLNTLAVVAPMIGLLGTVSGMVKGFSALTAGKADATELAKGIGEALIATGGGLLLAIPSMLMFFVFRGMLSSNMSDIHSSLSHMLDRFTGEAHGTPPLAQSTN